MYPEIFVKPKDDYMQIMIKEILDNPHDVGNENSV